MRNYEIGVIFDPGLDDAGVSALVDKIEGWIATHGGTLTHTDRWGKRRLAYPIQKKEEGYYIFWYASLSAVAPNEIERKLSLTEGLMRFLITRNDALAELSPAAGPDQAEEVTVAEAAAGNEDDGDNSGE